MWSNIRQPLIDWGNFFVKATTTMFLMLVAVLFGTPLFADQAADEAAIRQALKGLDIHSISPAPVAGLYEVVAGAHVVYMSADGRYMLQGELVDVKTRQSLTEPRRREVQRAAIDAVDEASMIVFQPKKVKHTVTVFTDIDCGYCRKLHNELDQYLDAGIKVRYMMYPRAGVGSDSYKKAVAVWCSDDRNAALTDAKAGKSIEMKTCENPIDDHMQLAALLGLRGTPFIVLEDGQTQPGYVPARQLSKFLDQSAAQP